MDWFLKVGGGWVLAMAIAMVTLGGCDPEPAPPTDRIVVGGDSLTFTTALAGKLDGIDSVSMMGWQAEHVLHGQGGEGVKHWVWDPDRSPGDLIIALGHNDAPFGGLGGGDGFTPTDAAQVAELAEYPHPDTCIAWIAPWYTGTEAGHAAGIIEYRTWLFAYATTHGQTVVDWQTYVATTPGLVADDGIHLTEAGMHVYAMAIRQAADTC